MGARSSRTRDLDAYLAEEGRRGRFSGSVLLTVAGRPILDRSYGVSNKVTGAPIVPETAFQIASVSKQFAAASILLLQERGTLSVSDRVREWIPGAPESWDPISLHHLLDHTSGLPHWREIPELDLFAPTSPLSILSAFSAHPLKFPPGTAWAYSSPGYHLLALVVEQASGASYADFLQRSIFDPLDMTRTRAGNRPPHDEEYALGYAAGAPVASFELETASRGAGDVWSTTRDLGRWDLAVSKPGRLLGTASLDAMYGRHATLPPSELDRFPWIGNLSYGYGWYLGNVQAQHVRFHPGDNPGYCSLNACFPERDALLCVLSNEESSDLAGIARNLLGGLAPGR